MTIEQSSTIKIKAREQIGADLKALRNAKGLTLRKLEELSGITNNHIARIEAGKYNVTIDTLAVILNALDADIKLEQK